MKNKYLSNLDKIEFVITYACTGKCKHCSEGNHECSGENIDPDVATMAVEKISSLYDIKTVMTFGGEPLLYPETVFAIMKSALKMNVPRRQVITNGFFSSDALRIQNVAEQLYKSGVNDLLLSVDAFHQETIPIKIVKMFALELKRVNVPVRLQPAWLVNPEHDNPYNAKTREILDSFKNMGIYENEGNIIFPEGNALKYLSQYFTCDVAENPYIEDPKQVRCVSFSPCGDVLGGNVYKTDISDILKEYSPEKIL